MTGTSADRADQSEAQTASAARRAEHTEAAPEQVTHHRHISWNRLRYSVYAPFYDLLTAPFQTARRRSIELLNLRPGERVLIVGCGTGLELDLLRPDVQVTAFDLTPAMVDHTAERAAHLGRKADVAVMNAKQIGFPNDTFDAVLLHLVLAVVSDPIACAQEAARVLRPGGRAAIFDKWLPEGEQPSPVRRALNVVARTAFSDLNRQLRPILAGTDLRLTHHEPVGLWGAYQASVAVRVTR